MNNTIYELTWYFFIYSFLGWCMEIIYAAIRKKKFLNRGVLNGPLCPVYGLGMIFSMVFFGSLQGQFIFLAFGCGSLATILEFFTGALMERLFQKRWWDYSDYRYNIGGYVCLPFSACWGILAAAAITFIHPYTAPLLQMIPRLFMYAAQGIFVIDVLSVLGVIIHIRCDQNTDFGNQLQNFSNRLGRRIFERVEQRMLKAHPTLAEPITLEAAAPAISERFAEGCGFHKLVWLFFISALLGDMIETIYCYILSGTIMSRSSVVYGPFSIVWGLGVVVLSLMLHRYQEQPDRYIFVFGCVVGGTYEYICSVFTELVFGTVFWDYSKLPFNLGGRINLLYCFFWGAAAVVWIKIIYPRLSGFIEKIPLKTGKRLTWLLVVFMSADILISAAALYRYGERHNGNAAQNEIEQFIDNRFPDSRMGQIYPNATIK